MPQKENSFFLGKLSNHIKTKEKHKNDNQLNTYNRQKLQKQYKI